VAARGLCAYNIHWETPVACPRNVTISAPRGSCVLTDPATGVVYDLSALARPNSSYTANAAGRSFEVFIALGLVFICNGLVCIFVFFRVSLDRLGFVFSNFVLLGLVFPVPSQEIG